MNCIKAKIICAVSAVLVVLASCALDGNGNITINLPPIESRARAIAAERLDDLKGSTKSYRVTVEANGQRTVKSGKDRSYSFSVPVGAVAQITVECLNADSEVIVRAVKTIKVYAGVNNVDIKLLRDGDEVAPPLPIKMIPIPGKDFSMSETEITQWQWDDVMHDLNTRAIPLTDQYGKGNNYPMYYVSWYDALVYCNRLSIKENLTPRYEINGETNPDEWGPVPTSSNTDWDAVVDNPDANGYRLPTEMEWTYAMREGTKNTMAGTNNTSELKDYAWYSVNSGGKTHEVKKLKPNGYGLYDMSGNVREFIWDLEGSSSRGSRGGSYDGTYGSCMYNGTSTFSAYKSYNNTGLRVVRSQ